MNNYVNKINDWEWNEQIPEKHNLPKLAQQKIENLNSTRSIKETEFIIKIFHWENYKPRLFQW